jgi:uncharacterized membrane protein
MVGPALRLAMLYPEQKKSLWQRLGRCYPPQIELVPLLLVGLTIYLVVSNYSTLPDTIPSHFNTQGVADDWGSKKSIFVFPALAIPIYVVFSALNAWISLAKDPKSLINLPDQAKAAISEARAEELRVLIGRCLFLMKTLIIGLMPYSVYATIEVARGEAQSLGIAFYFILGAILFCTAFMVWRSLSMVLTKQRPP